MFSCTLETMVLEIICNWSPSFHVTFAKTCLLLNPIFFSCLHLCNLLLKLSDTLRLTFLSYPSIKPQTLLHSVTSSDFEWPMPTGHVLFTLLTRFSKTITGHNRFRRTHRNTLRLTFLSSLRPPSAPRRILSPILGELLPPSSS